MNNYEEIIIELKDNKRLLDLAVQEYDIVKETLKAKYIWITIDCGAEYTQKIKIDLNDNLRASFEINLINEIEMYRRCIDACCNKLKGE